MGFLGFGKKRDVIDLTERYRKQQARASRMQDASSEMNPISSSTSGLGFLADMANASSSSSSNSEYMDMSSGAEEKRRKLSKRIMDMTSQIEDLSNQIYHLQQRLEVLERKAGVGSFG